MRKLLFIFCLAVGSLHAQTNAHSTSSDNQVRAATQSAQSPRVYICISSKAYRYHSDANCTGFRRCTHETKQVAIEEAKKLGYTPCHICYASGQ